MFLMLLAGCLLLATPPDAGDGNDSNAGPTDCGECPDHRACDPGNPRQCSTHCSDDDECELGYTCAFGGVCVEPCVSSECPGHYACDDRTETCLDDCSSDDDCVRPYHCCGVLESDCDAYTCVQ
jgi:hypothetical protein